MYRTNSFPSFKFLLARMLLVGFVLLSLVPISLAQSSTPSKEMATENVLVTVRIGTMEGEKRIPIKSFQLIVAAGTPGSKLLSGQRVPIPMGGNDGAITYQNIGFTANIVVWIVDEETIRVMADIEDSRLIPGHDGAAPVIETRQLTVNTTLKPGTSLDLVRAEATDGETGYVEMEVRLF